MPTLTAQPAEVAGRPLALTNLGKVLWPDAGYTKADLIRYYVQIAPFLLPHLLDRPLTVTRHPNGILADSFYQKDCPPGTPDWVTTHRVEGKEKAIDYILADSPATLAWLANQAAIEVHPWLSRIDAPDHPDVAVIDLDPAEGATFADVVTVARLAQALLAELRLAGYPKISGATGLHVYVPIERRYAYRVVSRFVGRIGELIVQAAPDTATNERLVKRRTGRVYVDHLQNLPGKTIAAPYSLRPLPGAPVSMPITWEEVGAFPPDAFNLETALSRVQRTGDLFAPVLEHPQNLDAALQRLDVLPD